MASSAMPSSNKLLTSNKMNIDAKPSDIFSYRRIKSKERVDVVKDCNIDNTESNNTNSMDENNVILKEEDIFDLGIKRSNGTLGEQVKNTDRKMNVTRITDEIVFKDDKNKKGLHFSNKFSESRGKLNNEIVKGNDIEKIGSAFFYGISSLGIMFLNKLVLGPEKEGYFGFPSVLFLAITQFATTSLILAALGYLKKINITPFSPQVFKVMLPLALISSLNVVSGLGGTKLLNLPMMTCLRRFSILFTMILQSIILKQTSSNQVKFSVFLMILGAFVAAYSDLTFNLEGYTFIFFNNILTASNGVFIKKMGDSLIVSKLGVLYYNSCMSIFIILPILLMKHDEIEAISLYPHWQNSAFIFCFGLASLMGSILNYATYWCTTTNSALTTTVIGCLKNVLTAYLGMASPSYLFSWTNFIGLNLSIIGSLYYSIVEFFSKKPTPSNHADKNKTNIT